MSFVISCDCGIIKANMCMKGWRKKFAGIRFGAAKIPTVCLEEGGHPS
jgi:hypothetical protein